MFEKTIKISWLLDQNSDNSLFLTENWDSAARNILWFCEQFYNFYSTLVNIKLVINCSTPAHSIREASEVYWKLITEQL